MIDSPIQTADEAMDFIAVQRAMGLTPVMKGTRFYRHSFAVSQFGSYLYYLDARGTKGCCEPRNLLSAFDFIHLGLPVPGSLPDLPITREAPDRGVGLAVGIMGGERQPSLLAAAEAALRVMPEGPERDDLEMAVMAERRLQ